MIWTLPPPPAIERPVAASALSVPTEPAKRAAQDALTVALPLPRMSRQAEVGAPSARRNNALLGSPRTLTVEQYETRKRRHIELAMLKAGDGLSRTQGRELAMLRFELEQHNKSVEAGSEERARHVVAQATRRHAELADAIERTLASLGMAEKSTQRRRRRT